MLRLNELVTQVSNLLNKNVKPIYPKAIRRGVRDERRSETGTGAEPRHGDIKHSFADIKSIEKKLGFTPSVEFKEGLKQTINYFERIQ